MKPGARKTKATGGRRTRTPRTARLRLVPACLPALLFMTVVVVVGPRTGERRKRSRGGRDGNGSALLLPSPAGCRPAHGAGGGEGDERRFCGRWRVVAGERRKVRRQ